MEIFNLRTQMALSLPTKAPKISLSQVWSMDDRKLVETLRSYAQTSSGSTSLDRVTIAVLFYNADRLVDSDRLIVSNPRFAEVMQTVPDLKTAIAALSVPEEKKSSFRDILETKITPTIIIYQRRNEVIKIATTIGLIRKTIGSLEYLPTSFDGSKTHIMSLSHWNRDKNKLCTLPTRYKYYNLVLDNTDIKYSAGDGMSTPERVYDILTSLCENEITDPVFEENTNIRFRSECWDDKCPNETPIEISFLPPSEDKNDSSLAFRSILSRINENLYYSRRKRQLYSLEEVQDMFSVELEVYELDNTFIRHSKHIKIINVDVYIFNPEIDALFTIADFRTSMKDVHSLKMRDSFANPITLLKLLGLIAGTREGETS